MWYVWTPANIFFQAYIFGVYDFKKVTMQLSDYEIQTCFYETLYDRISGICKNHTIIRRIDMFDSSVFTLHFPPDILMHSTTIKLKNSIFPNGLRPAKNEFFVLFGYPNQIYHSTPSVFYTWPSRANAPTKNYAMKFNLRSMEVLRKRRKNDDDCYHKQDYDSKIMEIIMENTGCSPIQWANNQTKSLCKTRKSFQEMYAEHSDQGYRLIKNKKYLEPCLGVEKIQIEYVEDSISNGNEQSDNDDEEGWFLLDFFIFNSKFKEVRQVRKYSVQSLVGNAGGYIGLCLGYALMNLPAIIMDAWGKIKDICFK